jgi:hypothetical protein
VLKRIRALATSDELQEIFDKRLTIPDMLPRQYGALGTSPRDHQVVSAGGPTVYPGSDPAERSLQRLDESLGKSAQGYNVLTEALKRFVDRGGSLTALVAATNSGLEGQSTLLGILRKQAPELGQSLTGLFAETTEGAESLDRAVAAMGERFLDAFEGAIVRGESLGDVLKSLGRDLANLALNELKTGGFDGLFGMFGKLFGDGTILNAKGNVFDRGHTLTSLARGGALTNAIVNRPTLFPMADGAGLMGEDGPEAVLPLTRLANGDLGVSMPAPAPAAPGPNITYNIDARGADREGLRHLTAALRQLDAKVNYLDRTLDRRAVNAMAYARGRGGNIARAFGGW